ncbi:MAG TPA: GNAT family N-acetyltransferase [Albitalea sp.]|uniref:GNAT family N-acetyltransferase n=1 Tax=Piscinibacter sp. TaxID=1903157 RepID=UPI002ED49C2E
MSGEQAFVTERLRGRNWRASDRDPFARMCADPAVMRHFPGTLDRAASDALVDRVENGLAERGWGLWAIETVAGGEFIGFVGLAPVPERMPFAPAIEIGWRLASAHWGRGYATEAARAALGIGFERLALPEIVSFAAVGNERSRAVMQRLGMRLAVEAFEHPGMEPGHPLGTHCLYRLAREDWRP